MMLVGHATKMERQLSVGEKKPPIHSGHFMVSQVHDVHNDDEEDYESVSIPESKGYDFLNEANKEISNNFNFGGESGIQAVNIDASLTKLFECMTLAYSGKITSPRWKQFRGMHLSQKQRIRLNNIIWREWHMQYIYQKSPLVCNFAVPFSDDIHSKPEAVVLEGKYWKRKLDTVTAEYRKWRVYFKQRIRGHGLSFLSNQNLHEQELLEKVKEVTFIPHGVSVASSSDLNLHTDMDMDFTNDLFASLNQPFAFPNPRELSHFGYADFIQPGLIQLQPNLEEFMDIDSMQELLNTKIPSPGLVDIHASDSQIVNPDLGLVDLLSEPVVNSMSNNNFQTLDPTDSTHIPHPVTPNFLMDARVVSSLPGISSPNPTPTPTPSNNQISNVLVQSSRSQSDNPLPLALAPANDINQSSMIRSQPVNNSKLLQVLQQSQSSSQPQSSGRRSQPKPRQPIASSPAARSPLLAQTLSSQSLSQTFSSQPLSPVGQSQSLQAGRVGQRQTVLTNRSSVPRSTRNSASGVMSDLARLAEFNKKKDGLFAVPQSKPSRKNREIRPAPPTTQPQTNKQTVAPSAEASYLAQLLRNGTYPGAMINIKNKKEEANPQPPVPVAISPIMTTTNVYPNVQSAHTETDVLSTILSHSTKLTTEQLHELLLNAGIQTSGINLSPAPIVMATLPKPEKTKLEVTLPTPTPVQKVVTPSTNLSNILPVVPNVAYGSVSSPVSSLTGSENSRSPAMEVTSSSPVPNVFNAFSPKSEISEDGDIGLSLKPKRVAHLSAEQKRRCNLKTGFDMLQQLVPSLSDNPKVSKATMLQKTAEYCKKLKNERAQMQKEAAILKQEIEALNSAIGQVQSQLPETGVPVTRQRKDQLKEMFDEYVRTRTLNNWKFWIFSVIMNSLYDSYCNTVSTVSVDEMCRTSLTWLDQSCSLVTLRPNVLNALRKLCTTTSILTEPQRLKDQALEAVSGLGTRTKNTEA